MSRAGNKAFDGCDVRAIEFIDYVFERPTEVNRGGYINPVGGTASVSIIKASFEDPDKQYAGSEARLHCPRTEDERVDVGSAHANHDGRVEALKSVRSLAGELICRNCRFSAMTPVQVSQERASLLRVEAERTEALAALEAAHQELQRVIPSLQQPAIDTYARPE